jgi:peptide/nickel transport system ATP-binding protein
MDDQVTLLELHGASRNFVKRLDLAARIAGYCGAVVQEKVVHAVDGVDMEIRRGEVVGLVGESGCGKSTLGRMIAGLLQPTAGEILYRGKPVNRLVSAEGRRAALKIQMIFQDPFSSLNPRMNIAGIIGEAPLVHRIVPREGLNDYIDALMIRCGIDPGCKRRFPHQFSGGQRQRIGIARALAVNPELIVCDEAVSSLDVSIQAQILNLFMKLREELRLTYLFISHDIGVVEHVSDRVAVMYLGRIVETGKTGDLFARPAHPYTRALLEGVPRLERRRTDYAPVAGEIPSPLDPPAGCHFHPRCPHAEDWCWEKKPEMEQIEPGHFVACHREHGDGGNALTSGAGRTGNGGRKR